jgi:hypothetical protein
MTFPYVTTDPILRIYLSLAQYPILRTQIRERMRRELFNRLVITSQDLEGEVRKQAIRSQIREGVVDPLNEELDEVWESRLDRIRNHLTDFYFANNLPYELFEEIVRAALAERGAGTDETLLSFNPELAPQNTLFDHAFAIDSLSGAERIRFDARLREIKVVLIRKLISDQLAYVSIAKNWLTIQDLDEIRQRKIGYGKIGGKAAGMLLAARILREVASQEVKDCLRVPESYYLGADLMYTFMAYNGLMHWNYQKYKVEEQIRAEYPQIQRDYLSGGFPPDILEQLSQLLEEIGPRPLIVRSSSLLEDNFGTSFAGKYESYFCPNQGSLEANLTALVEAIIEVYTSSLNPDALFYRRSRGLEDYDERMAILIQVVQGESFGRYFMPQVAGVAFSKNLYRWSPQIRREEGFVRLVWGLGTRAVDRVGNDYPRLVALSHPLLRPEASPKEIVHYSQRYVDVIDMEENRLKTLPIHEVLNRRDPVLRYLVQVYREGFLSPLHSRLLEDKVDQLVLTFDGILSRTPFADYMREALDVLEEHYRLPVDMEFALRIPKPRATRPDVEIILLQCRPQSRLHGSDVELPKELAQEDIVFRTRRVVPRGYVKGIQYVVFVTPEGYYALPSEALRARLRRVIGQLNTQLDGKNFILVGPGRWGTTNPDLGVRVGYGDIYNARALVELSGQGVGPDPELSFGTHFFQDLIEAQIYPLAIYLDDEEGIFRDDFFYDSPNLLLDFLPEETKLVKSLRLIKVETFRPGHLLELVMDDEAGEAVAILASADGQEG